VTAGIQEAVLSARMQPLGNVLTKFQRIVRDLGHKLEKEIAFVVEGGETELDRTLLEALADPLTHIVRNCCDHGIEMPADRVRSGKPAAGTVSVKAWHEAGRVRIRIKDDGKGIDAAIVRSKALDKGLRTEEELGRMTDREIRQIVFLPGFSTAAAVSDLSGRGVGMDVVRSSIERLGGTVVLDSETGMGTTLDLQLPLTLAIVPALVVLSGGCRFAIPQGSVDELVRLYDEDVERIESAGREDLFRLREHLLPLISLGHVLSSPEPLGPDQRAAFSDADRLERSSGLAQVRKGERVEVSVAFAVLKAGEGRYGLVLDKILGTEEIVVEPLHCGLGNPEIYSGATVLGDGEIALILDAQGVCRHAGLQPADLDAKVASAVGREDQGMLLFRAGPNEQLGLPLSALRRVVRLRPDEIECSGDREYVQLEDRSVRVERLDNHLALSHAPLEGDGYLLLPSGEDRSWGILASSLVDSGRYSFQPQPSPEEGPLVRGTALLRGHRTLLLDEARLRQELTR
jgi:two-component system, chemotaxis family, sensor kinase CheA